MRLVHALGRVLSCAATAAVCAIFLGLLAYLVARGADSLSLSFLVAAPERAGRAGGIAPIIVSTALILLVCMAAAVPVGVATAVYLSELSYRFPALSRRIRQLTELLAGVPSIVFGLFGNAFFCKTLGMGFSILSGGLTLACMVLPLVVRTTEEGLSSISPDVRMGAYALGLPLPMLLWKILLPAAAPAVATGAMLGLSRATAETAALIFTSGYVDRMPSSLLDSGRSLSVHIYDLSINVPGGNANASASALVLVTLLALSHLGIRALVARTFGKEIST